MPEETTLIQYHKTPASIPFVKAMECSSNNLSHFCQCCCGRKHWDSSDPDNSEWFEYQFEGLNYLSEKEPNTYIKHNGSVQSIQLEKNNYVIGCQCNFARVTEEFVINHQGLVLRYLNNLHDQLKADANVLNTNALELNAGLKKPNEQK